MARSTASGREATGQKQLIWTADIPADLDIRAAKIGNCRCVATKHISIDDNIVC